MSIRDLDHRFLKTDSSMLAGRDLIQNDNEKLQVGVNYNFLSGIVREVISNPYEFLGRKYGETEFLLKDVLSGRITQAELEDSLPEDRKRKTTESSNYFINPQLIDNMPLNSLFVYLIDENQAKDDPKLAICYPFFPPHLSMPIKTGEYVWLVSEEIKGVRYYYWMCRKVGALQVDDINYTNYERMPEINNIMDSAFASQGNTNNIDLTPAFSLDEFQEASTQGFINNSSNFPLPMSEILKTSLAYNKEFTGEPVPRMAKDCSDLLIQGSNNAGIQLTTEKFTPLNTCRSNVGFDAFYIGGENIGGTVPENRKPHSAAIDIFVTRKKNSLDELVAASEEIINNSAKADGYSIKAHANDSIADKYDYVENNKIADIMSNNMSVYNQELNDSLFDAIDVGSRVYLSHNCDVDFVFGSTFDVLSSHSGPSVVTYSNNNRMIGETSTRIVNKAGSSFIDLDLEGNVVMKASIDDGQQFLSLANNGVTRLNARDEIHLAVRSNNEEFPKTEPYILHSELSPLLKKMAGDIAFFNTLINTLMEILQAVPLVGQAISAFYQPIVQAREARARVSEGEGFSQDIEVPGVPEQRGKDEDGNEIVLSEAIDPMTISLPMELFGDNINSENFFADDGASSIIEEKIKSTKIFGETNS